MIGGFGLEETCYFAALGGCSLATKRKKPQSQKRPPISGEECRAILQRKFEDLLLLGIVIDGELKIQLGEAKTDNKLTAIPLEVYSDEGRISHQFEYSRFTKIMAENFVVELNTLLNFSEKMRKRQLVDRNSPLHDLKILVKPVKNLRDLFAHIDEYLVEGTGSRPENFTARLGPLSHSPFSNYLAKDVVIASKNGGYNLQRSYLIGGRLDFFALMQAVSSCYIGLLSTKYFSDPKFIPTKLKENSCNSESMKEKT